MSATLKAHVESIVNPLRAFDARKARYREELFAHLLDLVGECRGNEAEAINQFGECGAIRSELQKTVPLLEQIAALQLAPDPPVGSWKRFMPNSGEGAARYGFRMANYILVAHLVICALTIIVCVYVKHGSLTNMTYLGRPLNMLLPLSALTYFSVGPLLAFGAFPGTGAVLAFRAFSLTFWILILMAAFVWLESTLNVMSLNAVQFAKLASTAFIAPWGVLIAYELSRLEQRRHERWQML